MSRDPLQITACSLPDIDTRSLALFIKLSKLDDSKIFTFIDSLKPDEFKVFDYYAKYLCVYHEFDALFKIKYLKEYGLQDANKDMRDFVDKRYFIFKIVNIPNPIYLDGRTQIFLNTIVVLILHHLQIQ